MRAVIFANGVFKDDNRIRRFLRADDVLIAADGGGRVCLELGVKPDVVIGDLDSLSSEAVSRLEAMGSRIRRFPARKDHTDLELALDEALARGADEIVILAALGARWDMSLGNVLLLARPGLEDKTVRLVDQHQDIMVLHAGQTLDIHGAIGDTVSLLPLGRDAGCVSTAGLEYGLDRETLRFGATRGLSNSLTRPTARIHIQTGLLICVHIRGDAGDR